MIVRPRPSAIGLLFILRGSTIPAIAPELLAILVLAAAVVWLHQSAPGWFVDLTPTPFTLLGLALSIFLGFRNNACYERWLEARLEWGRLLSETRAFTRDLLSLMPSDKSTQRRMATRTIAFAHALRSQLRGDGSLSARDWLAPEEWDRIALSAGWPDAILRAQSDELGAALRRGEISDILYRLFSDRLAVMTAMQTVCERLQSTPMPFAYTLLLHRTAWLFCLLLPFGLVSSLGFATPVVTVILAYTFFGLDALGQELEEPFGVSPHGVPLDALVRSIEIATLDALGDTALPPPLLPQGYVLL
jgi:putative membrane protein